jgi:hypothetical protein
MSSPACAPQFVMTKPASASASRLPHASTGWGWGGEKGVRLADAVPWEYSHSCMTG